VMDQGVPRCWGADHSGQVSLPRAPKNPRLMAAMHSSTCVLDDVGVLCWGSGGQHAVVSKEPRALIIGSHGPYLLDETGVRYWNEFPPSIVMTAPKARALAMGWQEGCAIDDQGLRCEGANWGPVPPLSRPRAVALGDTDVCALDDGGLKCWNKRGGAVSSPVATSHPKELAVVEETGCVLDDRGAQCWGKSKPLVEGAPRDLPGARSLALGPEHACALSDAGIHCWGKLDTPFWQVPALKNPRALVSGSHHTCALDDEGMKCWGGKMYAITVPRDFDDWSE
jgi:hypothetical protein